MRDARGFTLIELLVVVTIIGVLAAVVSVGVAGFIDQSNQSARAGRFTSMQSAGDAFAGKTLDSITGKSKYPFAVSATSTVKIANLSSGETANVGWYGPDGKVCGSSGAFCASQPTVDQFYTYVDIYSGNADTDLVAGGLLRLNSATAGVAGVAGGASAFRCLFDSANGLGAPNSNNAVATNRGKVLFCRDRDP